MQAIGLPLPSCLRVFVVNRRHRPSCRRVVVVVVVKSRRRSLCPLCSLWLKIFVVKIRRRHPDYSLLIIHYSLIRPPAGGRPV